MKYFFLALFTFGLAGNAESQITQGNLMVGGQGSFLWQDGDWSAPTQKKTAIVLSTNIGYFFIDKLAGGVNGSLNYNKFGYSGNYSKEIQIGIGPFIRYYFLDTEKRVNIFTEAGYQYAHCYYDYGYGRYFKNDQNIFNFSAGPVIFFNSSIGLELTANYDVSGIIKKFYLGIGFQIHLEKDQQ